MPYEQEQFLDVVDRDTAERRWWNWLRPAVLDAEEIPLDRALGRVLAEDVVSTVDVPPFDRSNVDGFAVRSEDTYGASEESPRLLSLNAESLPTGVIPGLVVEAGTATSIATGGVVPRGSDAVVMIEHCLVEERVLKVRRPVPPGAGITFAGTDIARGERILRQWTVLTARETGVLAALGLDRAKVIRRPRVGIISTGDEIVPPGQELAPGKIHDSNSTMLADTVRELGAEPIFLGIVPDDPQRLRQVLEEGLEQCDLVLLSGGTSKGNGDISYRVLAQYEPGILVHGVALKPGKPICLGAVRRTPVAILPGFPTSAIFTFHEFIAPVIRVLAGRGEEARGAIAARLPFRYNSEIGRTEYVLVNLVQGPSGMSAYPLGKGSGSVTTFSLADGFITIPRLQEYLEAGETLSVIPIGRDRKPVDLVVIGSHCTGLDYLLGRLNGQGFSSKSLWVGSQGGLIAVGRGECDLAGIHLLDPRTNQYNRPFLPPETRLLRGYGRMQGIAYRPGDKRFEARSAQDAIEWSCDDRSCFMVNRNRGSGTRILIDGLLKGRRPPGYAVEARSHNAVAAAIVQNRADWGMVIAPVARSYGLGFIPVREEKYDFAVPASRWDRPPVVAFRELLASPSIRQWLAESGFLAALESES